MNPVLSARGLRYRYEDGTTALDGIDFELRPGENVALLGPNGSGKTTFVMCMAGLIRGEGTLNVCGKAVVGDNLIEIRSHLGIVFQDSDEQLFMPTVLEDVSFGPRNQGLNPFDAEKKARQALAQVELEYAASKSPYHLSAGEKRRAALAGVLAMSPEILVLDEPTTYLDPPAQRHLMDLLRALPQAKILITHDIPFAKALTSRAVFFEKGRVAGEGPTGEIVKRFRWEV